MSMQNPWEDQIALYTSENPLFDVLPRAIELTDRSAFVFKVSDIPLDHDLEWYLERDLAPLPQTKDREGYHGNRHFEYWLSGLSQHQEVLRLIQRYGAGRSSFVDLGSASGRLIRHMAAYDTFDTLWAFDISWRHVAWMQRYLPTNIKVANTSSIPHLPLEDNSVDCVAAMSVFTHIETFESAWLAELRRVLRPGGIAILTVVGEWQIENLNPSWPMSSALTKHPDWSEDMLDRIREHGKLVLRHAANKSYSSNVLYSRDYIARNWGRVFEVLEQSRPQNAAQDRVIVRKPS